MKKAYDARLVKKIHGFKVERYRLRERQPASWEEKVKEYIWERTQGGVTGMEHAR